MRCTSTGVMTDDLNAMADWLLACGVDTATGVYWIPAYEVLEQRGLRVWLVDAPCRMRSN